MEKIWLKQYPAGVPAELLTADGDFQSLPQRHGIDGAYAARLARRGPPA